MYFYKIEVAKHFKSFDPDCDNDKLPISFANKTSLKSPMMRHGC